MKTNRNARMHLFCIVGLLVLCPAVLFAQGSGTAAGSSSSLEITFTDDTGGTLTGSAIVSLSNADGKLIRQANSEAGHAEFHGLAPGRYTIQATAQSYDPLKHSIEVGAGDQSVNLKMHRTPADEAELGGFTGIGNTYSDALAMTTNVREHRMMMKIAQDLRDNKPQRARIDLAKLYIDMSSNTNLNYLYGVYEKEVKDFEKAKYYWRIAIGSDSHNFAALMELGHLAIDEGKPAEAIPYLKRAVQVNPTAWHPHALLVVAYSKLKQYTQAIDESHKALEVGHSEAAAYVQPALANALAAEGNRDQAIQVLADYVKDHPDADDARDLLAVLKQPKEQQAPWPGISLPDPLASTVELEPILPATWMPANVDDRVPPVEPDVPCSLDMVLSKASNRMTELVQDLDRFEASESLQHQRVTKPGAPSRMETRQYRYMVTIQEIRPGILSVQEFRDAKREQYDPPDGIVTVGLPGLALVFHPAQIGNYKFTCEGLARSKTGLAWQVYFQQRPDRYPTLHAYTRGDQSVPVGLKGRAWISADTYQIVRLESDLVKAYPEIRLVAEHTQIEYGPVRFRAKDIRLWLPQKAEVYFDWRGKRVHRELTYSNYSLFSVDSKQRINAPKNTEAVSPDNPPNPGSQRPD